MWDWIQNHRELVAWLGLSSVVMFVGGVVLVPVLLVRMPADWFLHDRKALRRRSEHPVLRLTWAFVRNVLGVVLILVGLALLVLPGQGILTILLGLALSDFPGKRRLEIAIIRRPGVHRAIDWIRRKWNRPPILLPDPPGDAE